MRLLELSLVLLLAAPALRAQDSPPNQLRADVWGTRVGDTRMAAAVSRARETLPLFHGYLRRAEAGEVEALLRARFTQGGDAEHMWISGVTWDGRAYRGVLSSKPMELTNVRQGQSVTLSPEQITDWMVVERGGVMLGNFTTMEIRARLSPAERAQMDRQMGYRILADTAIVALPR